MKKLFLLLLTVFAIGMCASAQTRTVRGIVLDVDNDEPLPGVSVSAGSNVGSVTDVDGIFSIVVPAKASKLTFSYVGYKNVEMPIPAKDEMIVKMTSATTALDEVIAVAYGSVKKSEYTGSASVVKAAQLENAQVANVTNALAGKMSGVQTQSSTGQPGAQATVIIRGVGTINAGASPLYVVDGIPYSGDVSSIATSDIESLTVLKDAASTALYGERGANGVILITTKKGTEGQAKVTVDMKWGSNSRSVPAYDMIKDQRQYLELINQSLYNSQLMFVNKGNAEAARAYANANVFNTIGYQTWSVPEGQSFFDANGKFNPYATPGYSNGRYYFIADDWSKEALINGLRQEYNMSITGGTRNLSYYLSGSYLGDEGIIYGSHFKRFSSRASVDYQAKPWLKIGTNIMYTYYNMGQPDNQSNDGESSANVFYFVNTIAPVYPMYIRNADGSIMYNSFYNRPVYDYGDGANYGNGVTGATRSIGNPTSDLIYNKEDYLSDILDAKWYAILTPVDGLTITGNASMYIDNTRNHSLANALYGQQAASGGQALQQHNRIRVLTFQGLASYNKTFADVHNIDVMAGYESEDLNNEVVYAIGSGLYQPLVEYVNNTSKDKRGYGYAANLSHRAFIARARYNYDGKYYVSASVRRGASSRFAPDKRWGTFWSASAGWDISKENFMLDFSQNVDMLKFKISFGQNGNDQIGTRYLAYADQYRLVGSESGWSDGTLAYKGNPDITWEKSNSFNTGFDFSFWKGKLSGTVEYYNRQTSDMIFNIPVAESLGFSSMPMNIGSMRNNGFEIDLNYQAFNTKEITWDIFANITFQANKILKLAPELIDETGYWKNSTYQWYKEGESMYQLYLPEYAGVNPETGYAEYWAIDDNGEKFKTPEYMTARNTNQVCTGSLLPKAFGGFGTTINAYGIDFSVSFAYQLGGKLLDYGYMNLMSSASGQGVALHKDIVNAWTPENTNTNVPGLFNTAEFSYANATSDRFLTSSNYLSLNNITLGYTLPKSWTEKLQIESIRVYGSAENVALWSKRKGLDPRQGYLSSENMTYSPIRTISGGIRVSF